MMQLIDNFFIGKLASLCYHGKIERLKREGELTRSLVEYSRDVFAARRCLGFLYVSVGIQHERFLHAPSARSVTQIQACKSADASTLATKLAPELWKIVDGIDHKFNYCASVHHEACEEAIAVADRAVARCGKRRGATVRLERTTDAVHSRIIWRISSGSHNVFSFKVEFIYLLWYKIILFGCHCFALIS